MQTLQILGLASLAGALILGAVVLGRRANPDPLARTGLILMTLSLLGSGTVSLMPNARVVGLANSALTLEVGLLLLALDLALRERSNRS